MDCVPVVHSSPGLQPHWHGQAATLLQPCLMPPAGLTRGTTGQVAPARQAVACSTHAQHCAVRSAINHEKALGPSYLHAAAGACCHLGSKAGCTGSCRRWPAFSKPPSCQPHTGPHSHTTITSHQLTPPLMPCSPHHAPHVCQPPTLAMLSVMMVNGHGQQPSQAAALLALQCYEPCACDKRGGCCQSGRPRLSSRGGGERSSASRPLSRSGLVPYPACCVPSTQHYPHVHYPLAPSGQLLPAAEWV